MEPFIPWPSPFWETRFLGFVETRIMNAFLFWSLNNNAVTPFCKIQSELLTLSFLLLKTWTSKKIKRKEGSLQVQPKSVHMLQVLSQTYASFLWVFSCEGVKEGEGGNGRLKAFSREHFKGGLAAAVQREEEGFSQEKRATPRLEEPLEIFGWFLWRLHTSVAAKTASIASSFRTFSHSY